MLDHLKAANRRWAADRTAHDPAFFARHVDGQTPDYLWIGCSDSRVPPNEIIGLGPGELFVHRNVANLAGPGDASWLAVLEYAVEVLRVRHVLVVGHYGCGGVAAAVDGERHGGVDRWLDPIRETAHVHHAELEALPAGRPRLNRLAELSVVRQVRNVADEPIVRHAWARGRDLAVHGWVYSLADGRVTDLDVTACGPEEADRLRTPRP